MGTRLISRRTPGVVLTVGAGLLLLAAATSCAQSGARAGAGGGTASSSVVSTGAPATGPTDSGPMLPSSTPMPTIPDRPVVGSELSLKGQIVPGAEPGCVIIQTTQGRFELLGAQPAPTEGDQVQVTGRVVRVMSHCMQGTPLQVESISTVSGAG